MFDVRKMSGAPTQTKSRLTVTVQSVILQADNFVLGVKARAADTADSQPRAALLLPRLRRKRRA